MLLLLWLALGVAPAPASPRPFTLEDVVKFGAIREVRVSPDGSRAVFVLRRAELSENRYQSDLWRVALDGSTPARPLTFHEAAESSPRWSPDGASIGFLARRGETTQVWALPAGGGEARVLSTHPESVAAFEWAPDGRRLLILAPPSDSEDERRRQKEKEDAFVLGRHWKNNRLWLVGIADASSHELTDGRDHVGQAVWSPDGKRIAVIVSPTPEADSSEDARARVLELDGGDKVTAVREVPGSEQASALAWSPDGRTLAFVRPFDGRGISREDAFVWAVGDERARNVSQPLDRDVEAVRWRGPGAIDVGPIEGARWLEAMVPLWVSVGSKIGRWDHAFKVVHG